jgi:hypothetical protein
VERTKEFDTMSSPFQQNYEDLLHTYFGEPPVIVPGCQWWDDRKRNHKPVLPIYFCSDISDILIRALSCLRLSGHNFLVQECAITGIEGLMAELRICDNVTGTLFRMRN